MIYRIKTKSKIVLFLTIFILTINIGYAFSFFTKQLDILKTNTLTTYTAILVAEQQQAMINPVAQALDFNLFVEESVSTVNGDIEGTAALGGDLNIIGSLTLAGNNRGSFRVNGDAVNTGLVVGGKIAYLSGNGINVNLSTFIKLGNTNGSTIHDMQNNTNVLTRITAGGYDSTPRVSLQTHQPANSVAQANLIDFSATFNNFRSYGATISQYPTTLSMTNNSGNGNITLAPNQVNVLNITGADLLDFSTIIFNQQPSANQPLIINIDASGTLIWNVPTFSDIGDTQGAYIFFNFYNTDYLILNGSNTIYGTIFAPNADITKNTSGNINGQVISRVYTHIAGELHHHAFNTEFPIDLPNTEICGNNEDDDNDGLIDNYDDDCCINLSIIPQANYVLHYTDSEQANFGEATNAFDGNTETIWHTNFDETNQPLPHEIQIDLGQMHKIGGLRYLPNRTFADGRMGNYEIYVSTNGNVWGNPVATGTLTYEDLGDKEISFSLVEGRYIRLVALTDTNGTNWTTALEINVLECKGQEICDDNMDNDGDGLVDCEDPDCSAMMSLSATTATSCGEDITISVNRCITYATVIADIKGNVTDPSLTIEAPDGAAAFLNRISDDTYTRMVWDFGEVIPDGEEVCFRVRSNSGIIPSQATAWLLNDGAPATASYSVVTTQSFVGTEWQEFCFIMPRASRYIKITDDGGTAFYVDAVGRKCRNIDELTYLWSTKKTTNTITVNGASSANYSVTVTSPGGCIATSNIAVTGFSGCPEICGNNRDDDGDGLMDEEDEDCTCPMIVTTDNKVINTCQGETVDFTVITDASTALFSEVRFYRFATKQFNPYTSTAAKTLIGTFNNDMGMGNILTDDFPTSNVITTYYVYAVLDEVSTNVSDCYPFLEYIVNVDPCSELEVNCQEGRAIETYYTGINRDIPKTLSFSDLPNIDSILVQIVYENNSPGNTITIQDNDGNTFNLNRIIENDIHLFERIIPATSSITYSNPAIQDEAQSITAYVYKSNQPGKSYARYSQQVSGHRDTKQLNFPLPDRANAKDITIQLPISELTFDNRELTFVVRAGAYTNSFTKIWGSDGANFPKGCCIDLLKITVPNVAIDVDNITIDIISPKRGRGQSYIVAGTVFLEFDFDGDIDAQDFDCSGYCGDNGTFLPYGMWKLENDGQGIGLYSEQYDLIFQMSDNAFLYWTATNDFHIRGMLAAYDNEGVYMGKYSLNYTAENVNYNTFEGNNILGSTSGTGKLTQQSTNPIIPQEILMNAQLNSGGLGVIIREYGINDIRIEGDWSLNGWNTNNVFTAQVKLTDCQAPREICGNGVDDDMDGLMDCLDPDCMNPSDGGTLAGNENNCGLYLPTIITEQNTPTNIGTGIPDYQWEQKIGNNDWSEISGAIRATYTPTLINESTSYRRKIRMGICNPWLTSNSINKIVIPAPFEAIILDIPTVTNNELCANQSYIFQATSVADAIYTWDFGDKAMPKTAVGIGPHNVVFDSPTDNLPVSRSVVLNVIGTTDLCVASDTVFLDIHPLPSLISVESGNPSLCGASDGWITLVATGEANRCLAVSLDGGITYQPDNQFSFTGLAAGSYEIMTRYCDGSCPTIGQIVNLSDPATNNLVNDIFLEVCPGFDYAQNVLFNDDIQGETVLTLASDASFGAVILEANGDFVYTSNSPTCGIDQFAYTICDASGNCCATAVVTIDFNDTKPPIIENIPADLTVSCDDEIPLPPLVSAMDNCPAISIDKKAENTQGIDGCALYDYTITYSWIAQDFCGNETIDSQLVHVKDLTAPDIYRVYTLPNGKRLVAGVMENVTHRWKVVQLPIAFNTTPLIFTQLVTTNESAPAIARMRNISTNQFEIRLQEEMANDGARTGESVAWFAIEEGNQLTDYQLETTTIDIGDAATMINFQQTFTNTPALFTTMQTIRDEDPTYPRNNGLSTNGVVISLQEEISLESDVQHSEEKLAYLAIDAPVLSNQSGEVFGETGKVTITNEWTTIQLTNQYINPVVIANSLSQNELDPAIIQVRNITSESFDISVREWDYLDGVHTGERVSYIVMEGSVPLNNDKFCEYGTDSLVLGVDIIAVDNCDQHVSINYEELVSYSGPQKIFTRIWSAIDECGNEIIYSKEVICSGVLLQLKAFLQGAIIFNNDGLMRDDLRKKGFLPLTEPYSANPNFTHIERCLCRLGFCRIM